MDFIRAIFLIFEGPVTCWLYLESGHVNSSKVKNQTNKLI